MNKHILLFFLLVSLCVTSAQAAQVYSDVDFQTDLSNYHIATGFNCTNITVYSTAFNINGGNITTYQDINMSMENLMNTTHLEFSNNATITNLTLTDNFADFAVADFEKYNVHYQSNDTKYQVGNCDLSGLRFVSIPTGDWYITQDAMPPVVVVSAIGAATLSGLSCTTDATGASWLYDSFSDSIWNYEMGIELFTGVGGLIVLSVIIIIIGVAITAIRGDVQIDKLGQISIGIILLIVIFGAIVMAGDTMMDLSDPEPIHTTNTLTLTCAVEFGQVVTINSETYTFTDGACGAYSVDISTSKNPTYAASQIVDSINTYSLVVSAV